MTGTDHATPGHRAHAPFWLRELPYLAILALTALGAGYVSMMRRPIVHYWDAVAVFIALVCVLAGWKHTEGRQHWRLVWTQVLHWGAFLIAMNMVFLPSVQALLNSDSTSLLVLFQLALGTFVAGVHTASVRLCINGAVMALLVPAIAWLDQSALMLTLLALTAIAAAAILLWRRIGHSA
jgi:hypothetical protein